MNDLVKTVSERVGLPEDKAKAAADTVINYVKNKLPAPIASQIDHIVGSGASGDVKGKPRDVFGE